jgi:hypothetical protein
MGIIGVGSTYVYFTQEGASSARTGTLTVAGQTVMVTQEAGVVCTPTVSAVSLSVPAAGGSWSIAVTAGSGCAWTASSGASWLSIGAGGTGSGSVSFTATTNTAATARTGTLTVAGQAITITQEAGVVCAPTVSAASLSVPASGGTWSIPVNAGSGCAWTASSGASWLSIGAGGTGNGSVSFTAAPNTASTTRTGTLTVAGRTIPVTQEAYLDCTATVSSTYFSMAAAGGTGSVAVSINSACSWSTYSNMSWLSVGSGGTGSGSVSFTAAPNTGSGSRTGVLVIAGKTISVTQEYPSSSSACTPVLSNTANIFEANAASYEILLTNGANCGWTVTSNADWMTVKSAGSGTGNGTIAFDMAANTSTSTRIGTITVAGLTFTATQKGVAATCTAVLAGMNMNLGAAGESSQVSVAIAAVCSWSASSNASWLTITSGANGTGSGTVSFKAAANTTGVARATTLTIAGQSFIVTQEGTGCAVTLSANGATVDAPATTGQFSFTAGSSCSWTATVSTGEWVTITSNPSGSGNGGVTYSVAANPTTSPRMATISVAGQTYYLYQRALVCTYALSTYNLRLGAAGGSGAVAVTTPSACSWTTSTDSPAWLSVTGGASGSGSVTVTAAVNTASTARGGGVMIAGQVVTVTQDAAEPVCSPTLDATGTSVPSTAVEFVVTVSAGAGCSWTASSSSSWLSILVGASGSGNGAVRAEASPNTTLSTRTGTLIIAGRLFTVTQEAPSASPACSPTPSSMDISLPASGGTGQISVTAAAGCSWYVGSASETWLTVTSGRSGTGNGTFSYLASANRSTSSRGGILGVGTYYITFTQEGASSTPTCNPTPSSSSVTVGAAGGTGQVAVSAGSGCPWVAVADGTSWLSVTAGLNGVGNGSVTFAAAPNPTSSVRTGKLLIAEKEVIITQETTAATPTCTPVLSRLYGYGEANGDSTLILLTVGPGCSWTATSNVPWMTIESAASGSGNAAIVYHKTANTSTSTRVGTLTIAGLTYTVTQRGVAASCTALIGNGNINLGASGDGDQISVEIAAGCAWTASSDSSWLTITSGSSGNGSGTVVFTGAPNTAAASRGAALTIAGQRVVITQEGGGCKGVLSTLGATVGSSGATGQILFTADSSCAWTASVSSGTWISVTSATSGTGDGRVTYSVEANPTTSFRTAAIGVAGGSFYLTQEPLECSYSLNPTSLRLGAAGGGGVVAVTTPSACSWTTSTDSSSWLSVTTGASGAGSVTITAATNIATSSRTGTVTIAGSTVTVTQDAAAPICTPTLSGTGTNMTAAGGALDVDVTASAGCGWTATSAADWLTIKSGASGSGNGTVSIRVGTNTASAPRTGTLTIAGQTFTITQAGAATTCSLTLSSLGFSLPATAGSGEIAITVNPDCPWTAASSAAWFALTSATSGSGSGSITYAVTQNTLASSRTATATVGDQSVWITQQAAGVDSNFAIDPTHATVAASGGSGQVAVNAVVSAAWTTSNFAPSWLSILSGASGYGSGTVTYTVAANPNTSDRQIDLKIAGQDFVLTQGGAADASACAATISPASPTIDAAGGAATLSVSIPTGCAWIAHSDASWLSITSGASGSGTGAVGYISAPNTSSSTRTATIDVGAQTVTVTQTTASGASTCSPTLSSTGGLMTGDPSDIVLTVTAGAGCPWTAASNVSWMSVTSGASGSGNGEVICHVDANTGSTGRTGTLTIADQTVTEFQDGGYVPCQASLGTYAVSVAYSGGSGQVTTSQDGGCAWTASSDSPWLTITSTTSGTGATTVTYTVAANTSPTDRTGVLTIAGRSLVVTQAGVGAACSATLSAYTANVSSSTGEISVAVTTDSACSWTATSTSNWLTVSSGSSGGGNGTVVIIPASNTLVTSRSGIVVIAGQEFRVTQSGSAMSPTCAPTLNPSGTTASGNGGTGQVTVSVATGCPWTASSNADWLAISAGSSGAASGAVAYSVTENNAATNRAATISIAGQTFYLTQAGI